MVKTLGRREFVGENVGGRGENHGIFASEKVKKGGFGGGLGRKFGKFDYCRGKFFVHYHKKLENSFNKFGNFSKKPCFFIFYIV